VHPFGELVDDLIAVRLFDKGAAHLKWAETVPVLSKRWKWLSSTAQS